MSIAIPFPLQMRREERTVWIAPRPVSFEQWLEIGDEEDIRELVDGSLVEKPMVQYEHVKAERWLGAVLEWYAEERDLGIFLGSRSPVKINGLRGRMPDLFFVRTENTQIVHEKATYGTPDLVIEFRSPNDNPSDIAALETDYRSLGVPEIFFVDVRRERVRVLRLTAGEEYDEEILAPGDPIAFAALDGLTMPVDWIVREPRPNRLETLRKLLGSNFVET